MLDKNQEYWWGKYRKLYRGRGCAIGYPRRERMNKPIFHCWPALNQRMLCLVICYGWWAYWFHIKLPVWAVKALTWYRLYKESKRKAP